VITLQDLYTFQVDAVSATNQIVGSLKGSGLRPSFLPKFAKRGVELPPDLKAAHQPGLASAGNGRG